MIYFEPGNFTLSELMALIKSVTAMILNNIAVKQNIIIPPWPRKFCNTTELQRQSAIESLVSSPVAGILISSSYARHHFRLKKVTL